MWATVAGRALRFLKVLVVARLLGPEGFGAYAALVVLINYAQFLDLGAATAAFRDLASAIGRGDTREAGRAAGRMSSLKLAAAALLALGAIGAAHWAGIPAPLRQGLLALPAIALSSALLSQVLLHFQAEGRSRDYAQATAAAAASDLVLGVGLTAAWGLPGLLAASAVSPVLVLAWAARRRALVFPHAVAMPLLGQYVRTGAPLAALALLDQGLLSIDQVLAMTFLSLRELGVYAVALVPAEAVRTLGVAAGAVLGPRLLREHARSEGSLPAIRRHALQPVLLYAAALPLPLALLWIAGGYALPRFYPAYAEAVRPMQVLLLATSFLVVLGGVTTFLFAIDKHARNLLFLAPALVLNVVLDLALLRLGWGLMAIAAGSLVTYFIYAAAVLWYVSGHFGMGGRARLEFLGGALLPVIVMGVVCAVTERYVASGGSLAMTVAACAVAAALLAPFTLRAVRLGRQLDDEDG